MCRFGFIRCFKVFLTVHNPNNVKKEADEDCFMDCWIWDQRYDLRLEPIKLDILEVSVHTVCEILGDWLPLIKFFIIISLFLFHYIIDIFVFYELVFVFMINSNTVWSMIHIYIFKEFIMKNAIILNNTMRGKLSLLKGTVYGNNIWLWGITSSCEE